MTFSRPFQISWLIVDIQAFQAQPPPDFEGGGKKIEKMRADARVPRKRVRIIRIDFLLSSRKRSAGLLFTAGTLRHSVRPVDQGGSLAESKPADVEALRRSLADRDAA